MSRDSPSPERANAILVQAAMGVILIALLLAWTLVFSRAIPVAAIGGLIADYERLLQAHIDFLLMGALLLGFFAAGVRLPATVSGAMAIGAYTNPAGFLYLAFWPDQITTPFLVFSLASFILTSYGFGRAAVLILRATLERDGDTAQETLALAPQSPVAR